MAGRMINGAAALAELIRPAGDTDEIGVHRALPVLPELSGLLPGRGLRRGSTVAVATGRAAPAGGGTSLLLALLAAASQSGSWCAVVGVPALGALAAAESGIALDRLALVPNPGPDWPTVVAALIDGVDLVLTAVPGPISSSIALPPGRSRPPARQCAGAVRQLDRRRPHPAGDPGPMGRPGPGPRSPAPTPGDRAGPGPGSSGPPPRVDNVDARPDHPARPRPASQRSRPSRSHPHRVHRRAHRARRPGARPHCNSSLDRGVPHRPCPRRPCPHRPCPHRARCPTALPPPRRSCRVRLFGSA